MTEKDEKPAEPRLAAPPAAPSPESPPASPKDEREARLAAALRANLRRRKGGRRPA
jgi:hypothetical protein